MTAAKLAPELDTRSALIHLEWLATPARSAAPDLRVEIAWGEPDVGPRRSRTFGLRDLSDAVGFAAWINRKGCNVYVGATLKSADAPPGRRCGADMAALATCLPVDSDNRFVEVANELAAFTKTQLLILTGRVPEPRGQLFVRIEPTWDLGTWETVHERIIRKCGGDANARGRGCLMRLGGSISYPSSAKMLRGYAVERTSAHLVPAPEYSVVDLLALLPGPTAPSAAAAGYATSGSHGARRSKPPLAAVEAALQALPDTYAAERHLWIKVGFALFDFDGGPLGLDLWRRFSQRCAQKAAETDFAKLWLGFGGPYAGHRITTKWLLREAVRSSVRAL